MRKQHYRVMLDLVVLSNDKANANGAINNKFLETDLTGEIGRGFGGSVNIQSVDVCQVSLAEHTLDVDA